MSNRWYPIIDYENCIGCMACSDICKHGVYQQDEEMNRPKVVYENGCVSGCQDCGKKCIVGAIRYFDEDGTLDINYDFETDKPKIVCEGKPKVAFVCVHNSCRSQIAEALGKKMASDVFESYSAGTELKDHMNPDAVRMMKQVYGIDMEETQYNKLMKDIPEPDVVIFMGCNVCCPNVPSQYTENWALDDPSDQGDMVLLETMKMIVEKINGLQKKLR